MFDPTVYQDRMQDMDAYVDRIRQKLPPLPPDIRAAVDAGPGAVFFRVVVSRHWP